MAEDDKEIFYEATINEYLFRYEGGAAIEISRVGDRHHSVLHEIPVKNLDTEKKFHSEISFWFMQNGNSLDSY